MKKSLSCFIRHILVFAVMFTVFLIWLHESIPVYPQAESGVLDLTRWDWKSGGRIPLSGEWELFLGELLTLENDKSNNRSEPIIVNVPQICGMYPASCKDLDGLGYATYRLKIKVPDTKTVLGLRISSFSTVYRFYINDMLLAQNGKITALLGAGEPEKIPAAVFFVPSYKEFDVIVHASNHAHVSGGMGLRIDFGTAEQIRRYETFIGYRDGIVIGILSVMAGYFFFYFYIFRRDRVNFSFMLMCLILIVRTSLYGDCLIAQLFPGISSRLLIWISCLTVIWFPAVFYQMIVSYINDSKRPLFSSLFYFYAASATAITGLAPVLLYTQWIAALDIMAVFIFITALVKAFLAHTKRLPGINMIFAGSLMIGVAGLHDILFQANLIQTRCGELTPVSLILFMLLLFFLMADRFIKAYHDVQSLSRELNDKLKQQKELTDRLCTLDKLKNEFLINSSDELRTPIDGIINITQSVLQGIGGQINGVQRQNLEAVLSSARKLRVLIKDLMDVSLLRSGGVRIVAAPLDMQALISNMLIVFRHLKKNESVALHSVIPPDFPPLFADEVRLRQILSSLLSNSLKYTEAGTIVISASHDGEWARICIKDTRPDITPEKQENIFNAFEQVDGTLRWKYEDADLGLYVARQLVELHGGKIWITSKPGRGCHACFTIPLFLNQGDQRAHPMQQPASVMKTNVLHFLEPTQKKTDAAASILAVDDDLPSLQAMINILHLAHYHVCGVSSGKDALRLLETGASYELVILDVIMPELSGFEVLESLRKKYNRMELPVLMLTPKSQSDDMSLCLKLGANDYLAKPFDADELMARVNSLVKLKRAVDKLIATEMLFLQAQIKPHFIQNALSVISSLSLKDPHKAKSLILDLSDYLRGSFDFNHNDEGLTTLSRELELVRAYLSIEQARFKERLQVRYQLIEDMDCTLPWLTIQPLVENAVRHGIMCRLEGGEVHIVTARESGRVCIEVRDNGVGIEQERILRFYELKKTQTGVGIANIHKRLIAHYGEGLHIKSVPGQGTVVSFYVPCNSDKEKLKNANINS